MDHRAWVIDCGSMIAGMWEYLEMGAKIADQRSWNKDCGSKIMDNQFGINVRLKIFNSNFQYRESDIVDQRSWIKDQGTKIRDHRLGIKDRG